MKKNSGRYREVDAFPQNIARLKLHGEACAMFRQEITSPALMVNPFRALAKRPGMSLRRAAFRSLHHLLDVSLNG